jgi:hypothetical protein
MTARIAELLVGRGAEVTMPPRSDSRLGYRFELDGSVIEVVGPEGLAANPKTLSGLNTFQVPGGTQALRRTERIGVSLTGGPPRMLRRPDLLGAILIKARAVASRRGTKFDSDRQDLVQLLSYVERPRELARELRGGERKWLQTLEQPLDFEDPTLRSELGIDVLERARQALLLLARSGSVSEP